MTKIITHNRFFNLDEIAAIALLDIFYLDGEFEVIRTRDEDILNKYKADSEAFVIDVGFKYDEKMKNFDHHQKELTKVWSDGTPYSSCGLIWEFLKNEGALKSIPNNTKLKLESNFIKRVDAQDNGIKYFNEMNFVNLMNTNHHDDKFIDRLFNTALRQVTKVINITIDNINKNKKDIFCTNQPINGFMDSVTSFALLKNFAFNYEYKYNIEKDLISFDFINLKNNPEKFILDFKNNKFIQELDSESNVYNVDGFMTNFVWDFMKERGLFSQKMNNDTVLLMENAIINKFSFNEPFTEASHVAMFENSQYDHLKACRVMDRLVINLFQQVKNIHKNNKKIDKAIKQSENIDGVVFFKENIKSAVNRVSHMTDDKQLVIIPRDKKSWKIQIVPAKRKEQNEISMPSKWCGLKGDSLKKRSGIDGLIFCHKSGFMCMFEGSKEDAIKFAQKIIEMEKPKPKIKTKRRNRFN